MFEKVERMREQTPLTITTCNALLIDFVAHTHLQARNILRDRYYYELLSQRHCVLKRKNVCALLVVWNIINKKGLHVVWNEVKSWLLCIQTFIAHVIDGTVSWHLIMSPCHIYHVLMCIILGQFRLRCVGGLCEFTDFHAVLDSCKSSGTFLLFIQVNQPQILIKIGLGFLSRNAPLM